MNAAEVAGIARAIIAGVGGYFVGQGAIDQNTLNEVSGAAAIIVSAVWSVVAKRKTK